MTENNEIWINLCNMAGIEDYTDYEASDSGFIRNIKTNRVLKQTLNLNGYKVINIRQNGKNKMIFVHRILCALFKPIEQDIRTLCVDHIDGNPSNNQLDNLRWVTRRQNRLNSKAKCNTASGYKNILMSCTNGRPYWRVEIIVENQRNIKLFKRESDEVPIDVIEYRNEKLRELHGEYACLRK